ncbi:uncharacterized protein ACLA_000870 [Aspergillus clavatus NRRL 1]|uniref:ER membrane protein complex subunit 7 beta-sandwich domain-containing protein n=1 Tax=Aspergillus clavatus (strain ATCC 1007 / CBS 513.65 / DSM 816 / NCTC 3887 / NRRL 1 / QM 1276 / 107) TaxID=344612 RepID=A1C4Q8_ASPCL|nr:uncharacterized protein ACLA_000870 [Aspergillus clavatus NRRL 1]EAW14676.1 conserved hypothetical protein [Aspergillus clavatus NRRL 1]
MYLLRSSLSTYLLFFAATIATAVSSSLTITIPPSNLLPNPNTLPAGTHATLISLPSPGDTNNANSNLPHPMTAPLTRSASFVFRNLKSAKPESYLLDIRSAGYVFAPYRVDVSADGAVLGVWETYRANPWDNRGAEKFAVDAAAASPAATDVAVDAKVLGQRGFYEERARFSPLSLLKNPMILLALVALGFTFGMPKLMENMDPEMRAEFEKQSRSSPITGATRNAMTGGGGPGNFDLAGWMAGAAPRPTAAETEPAAPRGAATGREGGGATRRRG